MTSTTPSTGIPELGGPLGRVASTRHSQSGDPPLDAIRLALATDLFEAAGHARQAMVAKDHAEAASALARSVWTSAWERAVAAASAAFTDRLAERFGDAARRSRMPGPMLKRCLPTEAERMTIAAHLGKGTGRLDNALEALEVAGNALAEGRGGEPDLVRWTAAVDLAARRVEAAWIDLEEAAAKERERWHREVQAVAGWRRPSWPLWVLTLVLVSLAVYLGLVFGGFVPPPEFLRPAAEFFWENL